MPAPNSTTRWRNQAIVPDRKDYEEGDKASLVKLAREARDCIVEFGWWFTEEDLRLLGRAVYEWGSRAAGRYKCFDARMLVAINSALDETDTGFALKEPKNCQATDCSVSCVRDGDLLRLEGHAPFDIVFGYGSAGIGQSVIGSVHLGSTAKGTLADAVAQLDWDLRRLQEEPFRVVRNALYNLPRGHGSPTKAIVQVPEREVPIDFEGPFSALDEGIDRCLFTDNVAGQTGVYLWTIQVSGVARVWYVGQTRRGFGTRIGEHIGCFLSGQYSMYDPDELSHGKHRRIGDAVKGMWPQTLPSVLQKYESSVTNILKLFRLLKFHFAPLEGDVGLYNFVEGAIGRYYRNHSARELSKFLFPGIRLPAPVPGYEAIRLKLSSKTTIAGLPSEIVEPRVPAVAVGQS